MSDLKQTPPLTLTRAGLLLGIRMTLPIVPGLVAFAVAFGAAASQRGMTMWQAIGMSAFVTGGAAQMMSIELWREHWTLAGIFTIAAVTAAVNARFAIQGASLQPWLKGAPVWAQAVSLFWLFENSWIMAERHRAEGGRDLGVFLGAGVGSWVVWVLATAPGYLAGTFIDDPRRYGLDLVLPVFFAAMAVPLWRGLRVSALPWLVAAGTGTAVQLLVPGYLFIVVGALAGAVTGGLSRGRT